MNRPTVYTLEQMEYMQDFIEGTFGNGGEGCVGHEIDSEYVHTDVAMVTTPEGYRCYATFGMGSREMDSPIPHLTRAELVMFASSKVEWSSEETIVIGNELQWLSKVPFRDETWVGPGHTLTASKEFRDAFGFDAFALDVIAGNDFPELGEVLFLVVIPIYQQEREKMMRENTLDVLNLLEERFGDEIYLADSGRGELVT